MLLVLVRIIQFLIALFFLRLLVHTVAGLVRSARPVTRRRPTNTELVRDRMCNTYVPRKTALVARVGGREESFCSPACRDRALAEVAKAS
jgi:hypothetical protein